jgi:hypothetical protein
MQSCNCKGAEEKRVMLVKELESQLLTVCYKATIHGPKVISNHSPSWNTFRLTIAALSIRVLFQFSKVHVIDFRRGTTPYISEIFTLNTRKSYHTLKQEK